MTTVNVNTEFTTDKAALAEIKTRLKKEQRALTRRKFLRNRMAVFGAIVVIILILIAIFADVIAPFDPLENSVRDRVQAPSAEHIFGTDSFGRDLFSRVIYGSGSPCW